MPRGHTVSVCRLCERCGKTPVCEIPPAVRRRTIRMGCPNCGHVARLAPIAGSRPAVCRVGEPNYDPDVSVFDVNPGYDLPGDEPTDEFESDLTADEARELKERFGLTSREGAQSDAKRSEDSRSPQNGAGDDDSDSEPDMSKTPSDDEKTTSRATGQVTLDFGGEA